MRAQTLLLLVLAGSLAGCAVHTPESPDKPVSYNRREMPPSQGLFTGPDGNWTVYQSGEGAAQPKAAAAPEPAAPPEPAPPKRREVLMCDRPDGCETQAAPD